MEPDQHGESHVVSWAILFRIGPVTREGVAKRQVIKTKEVLRSVDQICSSSSSLFLSHARGLERRPYQRPWRAATFVCGTFGVSCGLLPALDVVVSGSGGVGHRNVIRGGTDLSRPYSCLPQEN